ncbi:MAG TPA: hypothetical protein PK951_03625 [Chitinophagaceae bacterium]|nr:hypothetical protein [Chitinophagaceae bacterium]
MIRKRWKLWKGVECVSWALIACVFILLSSWMCGGGGGGWVPAGDLERKQKSQQDRDPLM